MRTICAPKLTTKIRCTENLDTQKLPDLRYIQVWVYSEGHRQNFIEESIARDLG